MDGEGSKIAEECYKITCKNYPSEFILDKNLAKEYFRQFGKLKKLTFRPKLRICTVEYKNRDGYLNALNNSGEYKGTLFKVTAERSPVSKKSKLINPEPIWISDDEVSAELEAMGGYSKNYSFSEADSSGLFSETAKAEKAPKSRKSWAADVPPKVKKKQQLKGTRLEKTNIGEFTKNMELINLIKSQAITVEEKYKILDARDKLIRMKLKRKTKLKSYANVGTCPDMCPEKERLMRETKHQVALYEQEDNGRAMNQSKAIKQYSRSSADQESPLPHELRPVSVLQMTMAYLMHNIINMCESNDVNLAEWYHFLWDRTRGIRKDITQQELCSQGAVELIEQCARFHIHCSARLVAEDPSAFDQKINTENLTKCLQSLKYMYHDLELKGVWCSNEAEFRAYIILLNLNDGNFMWEVQELRKEIQKSKEVRFGLEVHSALDKNNYVKFFKLVYSTTYLNACILMRYFVQVRIKAIKTLLKCYTSRGFKTVYPLTELRHLLAFDDIESTLDFMQAYGLSLNIEKTHIVLDKNTFAVPEEPYLLDRSLNVVESKRMWSVGRIVCGRELPPKTFENHRPQNSFDQRGYLLFQDLLEESDLEQTDMDESDDVPLSVPTDNSSFKKAESSIYPSIFSQRGVTIEPTKKVNSGNIFLQSKPEQMPVSIQSSQNIFAQKIESLFTKDVGSSIFSKTDSNISQIDSRDQTDSVIQSPSSIFGKPFQKTENIFTKPVVTMFNKAPDTTQPKSVGLTTEPKIGGFHFDLSEAGLKTKQKGFTEPVKAEPQIQGGIFKTKPAVAALQVSEDARKKKQEEEREKQQRKAEELRRKLDLLEREKKRLEEEKQRKIKKQKQEKELRRKMEQLRKEEYRKEMEIRDTVKSVLEIIVTEVNDKICREQLEEIRKKISKRMLVRMIEKWRQTTVKNKRKRKAMDCSPVWINTKTPKQSAEELHTTSQELTLKLRKRYRYGKALDIDVVEELPVSKINLFQLTYETLNRRLFSLKGTLQKNIFWKVEISLPDHYELRNGLSRIEETLTEAFRWEDRNGTIMLIEQAKPNPQQSVIYCIERQRGLYVRYADANGIIFIAKDFNSLLQRRILENLRNLGIFTKIPIVIILQEYNDGDCQLRTLIEENIVSDYIILIQNLTPLSLVNLVEESLIFLASKIEMAPPLELDTLKSFLEKYLCTEIWKRANSFAKWNSHYKYCLRNPNILINLYNEALSKLKKIVLNQSCFEYPSFPEIFKDYLPSEIPDYLPCNYYYFPKFWKNELYISKLETILNGFSLPKWPDKWPPSSELELEVNLSKYCTKVFREPEQPFYKIISVLLKEVDPNINFEDVEKVLWTDIIQVLAIEKIKQLNLSLSCTQFETKSIFNQFIVVYDVDTLKNYNKTDWFYINNPAIKKFVQQRMKEDETEKSYNETKIELTLSIDLDKTISEVTNQLVNKRNNLELKKELEEFSAMVNDLETSIRIHRKISSRIEENLKQAIADN